MSQKFSDEYIDSCKQAKSFLIELYLLMEKFNAIMLAEPLDDEKARIEFFGRTKKNNSFHVTVPYGFNNSEKIKELAEMINLSILKR